mmetsp:Transcript_16757/g.36464  ORF Transcript_16757/g.36464 Transcript_16757/m.36464 type:complete len:728 (+) Transcript_16757:96-2279(+)
MTSAGSVVLDAAISALVATRRRNADEEDCNSNARYGRRHFARQRGPTAAPHESPIVSFLQTLVSLIKRTFYVSVISTIILSTSVLSYCVIYQLSMPRLAIRLPIYFDYNFVPERHKSGAYGKRIDRVCGNDNVDSNAFECARRTEGRETSSHMNDKDTPQNEQRQVSTIRNVQQHPFVPPTAVVDLQMQHTQWHAYDDSILPSSSLNLPNHIIKPRRRYFVDIALTLPESDLNRRVGMFMLEVDLLASDGTMLASSGRPTMLPHESSLVGVARKLVLMGPILIGAVAEARTVVLEPFDSYVESADKPLAAMIVRLVVPNSVAQHRYSRSWSSDVGGRSFDYLPIQVQRGEVRIGKELNWVQRIMKEWFYSCGLVAVSMLSIIYAIWFLIIRAWFQQQMRRYRIHREEERGDYGDDYEGERRYGDFQENHDSSNWNGANGPSGQHDDQSSMSGVEFVELEESDADDETGEWDDIIGSNRSAQESSVREGMDEGTTSIRSTGDVGGADAGSSSMQTPRASPIGSVNDLQSLADELVENLSFDVDASRSRGDSSAREGVGEDAAVFDGFLAGMNGTPGIFEKDMGEEKKSTDSPENLDKHARHTPRERGPSLNKKRDADVTAPGSPRHDNGHRNSGAGTCSSNIAKKNATRSTGKKVAKKKKKPSTPPRASTCSSRNQKSHRHPRSSLQKEAEEKLRAEKVMKGDFCSYEVFTDLDEPDPDAYGQCSEKN